MDAFNRRDMAEVDRAVAAAAGSAAETQAEVAEIASESEHQEGAKRSCTNSGVEGERVVRRKLNLDNSDDEGNLSDASGVSPDSENIPTELLQGVIPRNRRLGGKIPSVNTDYSHTRLVTKVELKRLKELKAEQAKRKAKAERTAKANAVETVRLQPERTHGDAFAPGDAEAAKHKPHASHDVKHFAAATTMIMFCDHCGRWQRHDAGRSKLSDPCEEIREGNKSTRKLLRHVIIPGAGAKLPAHIKTSGGKRC